MLIGSILDAVTLCSNCEYDPAWRQGRCVACFWWWKRHGRKAERPYELVLKNGWRRWERAQEG